MSDFMSFYEIFSKYLFIYIVSRHNMTPPMTTPIATPIATANKTPATTNRVLNVVLYFISSKYVYRRSNTKAPFTTRLSCSLCVHVTPYRLFFLAKM